MNPDITKNQHFHVAEAIKKFYNASNLVEVRYKDTDKVEYLSAKAKVFCKQRQWDQRAEHGYMSGIERDFCSEIQDIKNFERRNHCAITRYFILWCLRHQCDSDNDKKLNNIHGDNLYPQQKNIIEREHGTFINADASMPFRFSNSIIIQTDIEYYMEKYGHLEWGLLESTNGDFLVADSYKTKAFMPISPTQAFAAGIKDQKINNIVEHNMFSISEATRFVFARNFSNCPME